MTPEPDAMRILRTAYGLYRGILAAPPAPAGIEEPPHMDVGGAPARDPEDPDFPESSRHG